MFLGRSKVMPRTAIPVAALFTLLAASPAHATTAADGFDFPVAPSNATEARYDSDGYYNALDYTEYYSVYGYHCGEDWNGDGGGSTDLGDPIYTVADGDVVYSNLETSSWAGVIIIEHYIPSAGDPGYVYITSMYGHLDSIWVSTGDTVSRGDQIGEMGDGWGYYYAHLHFEMRTDETMGVGGGYGCTSSTSTHFDPWDFIDSHRTLDVRVSEFYALPAEVDTNDIYWETTLETDNAGWNLFTSNAPDGARVKLNDAVIPPYQGSYLLTDQVGPDSATYYWLQSTDIDGTQQNFGPLRVVNTTSDLDASGDIDGLDLILAAQGATVAEDVRGSPILGFFGQTLAGSWVDGLWAI